MVALYRATRLDDAAKAQDPASPLWRGYAARRAAPAAADGRVATMQFELPLTDVEDRVLPAVARGQSADIDITLLTGFRVEGAHVDPDETAQMQRDMAMLEALPLAERAAAIAALNAGRRGELNASFRLMHRLRPAERAAAAAGARPDCALVRRVPLAPLAPPVGAPPSLSLGERAEVIRRCAASGVLSQKITLVLLKATGQGRNTPLAKAAKRGLAAVLVAAVAATPPHGGKQAAKLSNFYLTSLGIATPVAHVQLRRSLHREVERALARNAP